MSPPEAEPAPAPARTSRFRSVATGTRAKVGLVGAAIFLVGGAAGFGLAHVTGDGGHRGPGFGRDGHVGPGGFGPGQGRMNRGGPGDGQGQQQAPQGQQG